jgi:3,4-dihydroxy 2-butanone 4-phosphate synthase/GTP cyclohydrolase II
VLRRAGHTEAGCDLTGMAGLTPSSVICEIMNDDGTMARLPDLQIFAKEHGLKIGTIADLIQYRSRNESLIERVGVRSMQTPEGAFQAQVFKDRTGALHLALTVGEWGPNDDVLVRVHEPFTALDWLDAGSKQHSWPLPKALAAVREAGRGVVVLLNAGDDRERLLDKLLPPADATAPKTPVDLRTYGVGAQILKQLGVNRMRLLGNQQRLPSMMGYGLEVTGFLRSDGTALAALPPAPPPAA